MRGGATPCAVDKCQSLEIGHAPALKRFYGVDIVRRSESSRRKDALVVDATRAPPRAIIRGNARARSPFLSSHDYICSS